MKPIKSHYFSHDWDARQDNKIMDLYAKYDWEGYGLYWAILEVMAQNDGHALALDRIGSLAKMFNQAKEKFEQFVKDCISEFHLFESDGVDYWSNSLRERIAEAFETSNRCSKGGKKGMATRWGSKGGQELFPAESEKAKDDKPKPPATVTIPASLDTPEFRAMWERFRKHRSEIHKKLTPTSEESALEKLAGRGVGLAIAMVKQSIDSGWQGIFELKTGPQSKIPGAAPPAGQMPPQTQRYNPLPERGQR